jgi:hypothetical protein
MRSWIASAVVVTPPSFLVPEGLVCDPRPNDMEMSPLLRTNRQPPLVGEIKERFWAFMGGVF